MNRSRYQLTERDIRELTKPTWWRDYSASDDPRSIEEYRIAWELKHQRNSMVRVVNTVPHPSVVKEAVCRNCGATLQYVPNDIKESKSYDYTGDFDIVKYIKCPPCGNKVNVKGY